MGNLVTTKLGHVSLMEIYQHIIKDPALIGDLKARATLPAIVEIALNHPKGFSAHCSGRQQRTQRPLLSVRATKLQA